MKIICECGEILKDFEEGVNGSDYFECSECNRTYNVISSRLKEYCDNCEEEIETIDLGDGGFGCPLCKRGDCITIYS